MQCAFCKETIEDDSFYCDMCGEEIKFCPNCNKTGKGKACTSCGKTLVLAKDFTISATSETDGINSSPSDPPCRAPEIPFKLEVKGSSGSSRGGTVRINEGSPRIPSSTPPVLRLMNKNTNINLAIDDNTLLGREKGNYVSTFSLYGEISGQHCRFSFDINNGWHVTDLGSTNGTYLNKAKLSPNVPQQLKDKMFLKIANIEFFISIG